MLYPLLDAGVSPNRSTCATPCTCPLRLAIFASNSTMVHALCSYGADIDFVHSDGYSAVHYACLYGDFSIVSLLLEFSSCKQNSVNYPILQPVCTENTPFQGSTPLHLVVRRSGFHLLWRSEMLELLCKSGACINIRDGNNKTILYYILRRHVREVDFMLKTISSHGTQSLLYLLNQDCFFCTFFHESDKVRLLLDYGADPRLHLMHDRQPLIFWGLQKNYFSFPEKSLVLLLKHGTDFEMSDHTGKTILHQAMQIPRSSFADLDFLLNTANININITDSNGLTPLEYSIDDLNRDTISYLIRAGAKCQLTQERVNKLFFHIFEQHIIGGIEIIQFLFDMDPTTINNQYMDDLQRTPLHIATRSKANNMLRKMVELGANVEAKDATGRTPMEYTHDHIAIEILLAAGATVPVNCARKVMRIGIERSEEIVRVVAKKYPQLLDMDCDGKALLVKAAELPTRAADMVRLLVELGAQITKKKVGRRAIEVAIKKGNFEVVKILVDACPGVIGRSWKMDQHFEKLFQTDFQEAFSALVGATRNDKEALFQFRMLFSFMTILAEYDHDLDLHCDVLKKSFERLMFRTLKHQTWKFEIFGKILIFGKKSSKENLKLASSIEVSWRKRFNATFEKFIFLWVWKKRAQIGLPREVQQFVSKEWC
ncbi:hypothetical protein HK096_007541 [Nowakowskiella sp. JEL0078]|nr:hypothetical protein HK096_007541 [Nowakowskiella sp. JEL0078]